MSFLIILAGVLNLFLGITVLIKKPRKRLSHYFAIFTCITFCLIFFDFLFRFFPILPILKSSYAFAALVPVTTILWVFELCKIKNRRLKFILLLPGVFFFVLSFFNGFIVEKIDYLTVLGYKGTVGPLFLFYSLYFLI